MLLVNRWIIVMAVLVAGLLTACGAPPPQTNKEAPASVEAIDGSAFKRVVLTERAVERLAIQTAAVQAEQIDGTQRLTVPYDAVLYGLEGETWVYTSPGRRAFVRHVIDVDYIEGNQAVLSHGPPPGTAVVTVGVAELYGTETGVSSGL